MKSGKRPLINRALRRIAGAMFFIPAALEAQSAGFPNLEAHPRAYGYARRDGYSWQDLAEIALWASAEAGGTAETQTPAPLFPGMDLIRSGAAELRSAPADPRERGEFILSFMHRRFLKSYAERQTRLDLLLSGGRYNCVSSAVLYMILAASAGLEVTGVMTRDHAFVTVRAGTESVDVETTNRYGFDPGNRKEFQDGFGRTTGFAYVPARNYRDRSSINQLELISLILSNRIAEAESRGRYAEAVALALDRAALLSAGPAESAGSGAPAFFAAPEQDLLDRLYNFGAALIRGGKEEEAIRWAAHAGARYPRGSRWQEMAFAALNNLLAKHIRAQRIGEARETLARHGSALTPDNFEKLDLMVLDAELLRLSAQAKTAAEAEAALKAVGDAAERLPRNRIDELRTFVLAREAERRAAEDPQAAIAYIEAAIAQYGGNSRLTAVLQAVRSNRIARFHNNFAALYNRGNYEEARRAAEEALREFPGNRQLTADLNLAERALRNR
jgi:tetratricopeptide (TPR) repeat protein